MSPQTQNDHFQSRILRSTRNLAYWTGAWLLSTALLAFGPEFLWNEVLAMTFVALAINLLVGVGVIFSSMKHLKDQDELHQRVLLNAMAITLGVTMIAGIPYSLLDAYGVVDAEIARLYFLMSLTFMTAVVVGLKRYR
jgi:uncharacterized membrane protein